MKEEIDQLSLRLNAETARISWQELERHFARGALLTVSPTLDLVEVGVHMINDDKIIINAWMESGDLRKTTDQEALHWSKNDATLWAVVIAPWVLVQGREKREFVSK